MKQRHIAMFRKYAAPGHGRDCCQRIIALFIVCLIGGCHESASSSFEDAIDTTDEADCSRRSSCDDAANPTDADESLSDSPGSDGCDDGTSCDRHDGDSEVTPDGPDVEAEETQDDADADAPVFDVRQYPNPTAASEIRLRELQNLGFDQLPRLADLVTTQGFGGTVLDFDHDGDLDVLVGGDIHGEHSACLMENMLQDGELSFVPYKPFCDLGIVAHTATATDLDQDGRHELIVSSPGEVWYFPDPSRPNERELVSAFQDAERCSPTMLYSLDVDRDGSPEVSAVCQWFGRDKERYWTRNPEGNWAPLFLPYPFTGAEIVAALYDFNGDGLLDRQVGTSTRVPSPEYPGGVLQTSKDPGGWLIAGNALDDSLSVIRHGDELDAYGDPMGVARLWNEYHGRYEIVVSDWGKTPVYTWDNQQMIRLRDNVHPGLGTDGAFDLVNWSTIVDDFDRDGLDDLFITQGRMYQSAATVGATHRNVILRQNSEGSFDLISDPLRVPGNGNPYDWMLMNVWSSRGVIRADLDLDGGLELIVFSWEGTLRVFEEDVDESRKSRCYLQPRTRYTYGFGYGFGVDEVGDGVFRNYEVLGQFLVASSDWLLTRGMSGRLRFPSGYTTQFRCNRPGDIVVVEEPRWITVDAQEDSTEVQIDLTAFFDDNVQQVKVTCRDAAADIPATRASSNSAIWHVELPASCEEFSLACDEHQIDYRFQAP